VYYLYMWNGATSYCSFRHRCTSYAKTFPSAMTSAFMELSPFVANMILQHLSCLRLPYRYGG